MSGGPRAAAGCRPHAHAWKTLQDNTHKQAFGEQCLGCHEMRKTAGPMGRRNRIACLRCHLTDPLAATRSRR